jgi:hypothetical protein
MNEFDLQAWERELKAWHRRLERQPPGALRSVLFQIAQEIEELRTDPRERVTADLRRRFKTLRSMYESELHL